VTVWFSSDMHLGHAGVIKFCNRPFETVEEMDEAIVDKWNKTVRGTERVYVLGDVSFHNPKVGVPLLRRLNGEKILVLGNHDKYSMTQYRQAGFVHICNETVIPMLGRRVRMSHFPYLPRPEENEPDHEMRYPHLRPRRDGNEFLLCGHVHDRWKTRERMVNVGTDVWNFRPVSHSVIESLFAKILEAP